MTLSSLTGSPPAKRQFHQLVTLMAELCQVATSIFQILARERLDLFFFLDEKAGLFLLFFILFYFF